MQERVQEILNDIKSFQATSQDELEAYRLKYISKKSVVGELFGQLRNVAPEDRKAVGQTLNELKQAAQDKFKELIEKLESSTDQQPSDVPDLTLPSYSFPLGGMHPLTYVRNRIIEIFERIGFNVADGPEIEDDWHNFTALNFPENHPAREMQDTFFIERNPDIVLRTHTSGVQVRLMENQKPPIRSIMPGRVYRNEAISARAHCVFHQVEGLYVDRNVSFVDLKQTLYHFAKEMFTPETRVRYRPSYFPFTEPSAEIDISCQICDGDGCQLCKYTGWVEIAGSGMVDPNVLENCGINSEEYTGFAFGMGIERITQLKFQVNDLRLYTENDIRFLRQFQSLH
ncbi:phenylalanine--tRNA ligase subunit alpha [Fulvivirga sedimenti]|uniref:Phenylalanine--tRNA ligase alpha subunit n=1 Tax=Fulvivirga sedimenti TaxID=2879465 RepID=A0A9X1L2J7_9BACT|nr:phenylalanine--tRNA ligase subunit alpha [Fulvivirga sedimenti]MCA6078271.1 phenylalanine--tRNA ligase subunit alpha [Fulvivirga sedimenti]